MVGQQSLKRAREKGRSLPHQARLLMLQDGLGAGEAAYRVGYASASQSSREYSRLFGAPPRRDVAVLRAEGAGA